MMIVRDFAQVSKVVAGFVLDMPQVVIIAPENMLSKP